MQKRSAIMAGGLAVAVLLTASVFINERATSWAESGSFLAMLDRETSKGLKLQGSYAPLQRVGVFGMRTDSFSGTDGSKTIVSLQAQEISGTFNPLGIIFRRWEMDSVHIKSGTVMLQQTEADPDATKGVPWPPWWALFWPYGVYLTDVKIDDANILGKLRDKDSGFYGTRLEITPNGHDFEYDARGGQFKTPVTPPLELVHAHILIRKPRLYCSEFILGDDAAHPDQQVRIEGDAGLQQDRSVRLKLDVAAVRIAPWLPEKLRAHVEGQASGHFDYTSSGTGLETGQGKGKVSIANGLLRGLAPVHQYIVMTGSPDPGDLALKVCRADMRWEAGTLSAENIEVECDGVFRMTGTLTIAPDQKLSGQVEFGLTDPYLHWLPTARSAIFTRDEGPYHFTTIHFSGTAQKPEQDLSPRISREVEKSPLLALKLFFDQAGGWFDFN